MTYPSVSEEWKERAHQLQLVGAAHATPAEIAAVHAAFFPQAEAICQTCPRKYGPAYFRILRYLNAAPTTSLTQPVVDNRQYQFASDTTTYRPFGSPVVYSNANLTDSVAEAILKHDPKCGIIKRAVEQPPVSTLADVVAGAVTLLNYFAEPTPQPEPEVPQPQVNSVTEKLVAQLTEGLELPAVLQPNGNTLGPAPATKSKAKKNS